MGTYEVKSPLCAAIDAPIADGSFPLIVFEHGGLAGQDFHRVDQLPIFEMLASHGFIVGAPRHSVPLVTLMHDVPLAIDSMLDRFAGSADETRIGLWGHSAGGQAVFGVAAGRPELETASPTRLQPCPRTPGRRGPRSPTPS